MDGQQAAACQCYLLASSHHAAVRHSSMWMSGSHQRRLVVLCCHLPAGSSSALDTLARAASQLGMEIVDGYPHFFNRIKR